MSVGHAPLNTIEIDGHSTYLLAWSGLGGEADHLVAEAGTDEEARPAAYPGEPYPELNPAYDAAELTRARWSERTLCGRAPVEHVPYGRRPRLRIRLQRP